MLWIHSLFFVIYYGYNLKYLYRQDIENSRSYVDEIYSSDLEKCSQALVSLKNSVIGSNRQKGSVIQQGIVPRLLQLLSDQSVDISIRLECAVTIGKDIYFLVLHCVLLLSVNHQSDFDISDHNNILVIWYWSKNSPRYPLTFKNLLFLICIHIALKVNIFLLERLYFIYLSPLLLFITTYTFWQCALFSVMLT